MRNWLVLGIGVQLFFALICGIFDISLLGLSDPGLHTAIFPLHSQLACVGIADCSLGSEHTQEPFSIFQFSSSFLILRSTSCRLNCSEIHTPFLGTFCGGVKGSDTPIYPSFAGFLRPTDTTHGTGAFCRGAGSTPEQKTFCGGVEGRSLIEI